MNRAVRLSKNRWWRGFWLLWLTGFGSYDLVVGQWPFALAQAGMMAVIVFLWMVIDRNTLP